MKTPRYCLEKSLGMLTFAGFLLNPMSLPAQETASLPAQETASPPAEPAPQPERAHAGEVLDARQSVRMMRELNALLDAGKFDEFLQLAGKIRAIAQKNAQAGDRLEVPGQVRNAAREGFKRRGPSPGNVGLPLRAKIQHLQVAAENLSAAGSEKLAALVRAQIGRAKAEVQTGQEVPREQAEVRRDAGPDVNAIMKTELQQIRREIEELRKQLRTLKTETAPKHTPPP